MSRLDLCAFARQGNFALRENEVQWDGYRSLTLKVGESSRIQAVRIEYVEVAAVVANRRRREP
jgi:hypothetical protein